MVVEAEKCIRAGGKHTDLEDMSVTRGALCACLSLLVASVLMMGVVVVRASSSIETSHDGLATWLMLHPPRKVSHDAELLRRRMLAGLLEQPPGELAAHVPAILASMEHSDHHVRKLALGMLSRLEPAAVTAHAADIAEHLSHTDVEVRLQVMEALGLASASALASLGGLLVACLDDQDASVRWATVFVLDHMDTHALAKYTLPAVERLLRQNDMSLARSAVSRWSAKLDQQPEVLSALSRLNFQLQFAGSSTEADMNLIAQQVAEPEVPQAAVEVKAQPGGGDGGNGRR